MKPVTIQKRLASGQTVVYAYAYRGGPRVTVAPDHPEFEARRQAAIADHRARQGKAVASRRIDGEIVELEREGSLGRTLNEVAHKLVKNARHRASRRKMQCDVTVPYLADLLRKQGVCCAISGIKFNLAANLDGDFSRNPFGISIDRINSGQGYIRGNVRIVLSAVNYAINEWGFDQYLEICRSVAKRHL